MARGKEKEESHQVVPWLPYPLPSCSMSDPTAWVPFLHSHTCVHAHTHITHLVDHTVTARPLFLWARGGTPSWDNSKESGLGSGDIGVALSVSEQNLHIRRGSGFRSLDLIKEGSLGAGREK